MRYIFIIIFLLFSSYSKAADELTIKQQLERIMYEIKDLNKAVFNKSFDQNKINSTNNETERFTSIDIRIYDLEKDIKNLNFQFEELIFKLDDLATSINTTNSGENISLKLQELEARLIMLE